MFRLRWFPFLLVCILVHACNSNKSSGPTTLKSGYTDSLINGDSLSVIKGDINKKYPYVLPDSSEESVDTEDLYKITCMVGGKKYTAFNMGNCIYLLNQRNDTIVKKKEYYIGYEFGDFNRDGFKDLILMRSTNTPGIFELFLFDPSARTFKEVRYFDDFPDPKRIEGTKYYYSYHKSGCADMNWDSDLFYIRNFKAIRVGNIHGIGCGDSLSVKDGIYINRMRGSKRNLIETMPIDTILSYKEFKWGFIEEYWNKKYKLFI